MRMEVDAVRELGPKKAVEAVGEGSTGEERAEGPVAVWRFPQGLSQSKIGGRKRRSFACTIIAIRMAQNLSAARPAGSLLPRLPGLALPRRSKRKSQHPSSGEVGRLFGKRAKLSHGQGRADVPPFGGREHLMGGEDSEEAGSDSSGPQAMDQDQDSPDQDALDSVDATARSSKPAGRSKLSFTKRVVKALSMKTGRCGGSSSSSDESGPPGFRAEIPRHLLEALIRSLLEGNSLHDKAMVGRNPRNPNFDVPHAIRAVSEEVTELDWVVVGGGFVKELERQLETAMGKWRGTMGASPAAPPMSVLIISKERTVLFVYQVEPALMGLVDSHSHGSHGAVIAVCPAHQLASFCHWVYHVIFPDMAREEPQAQSFEVSLVFALPPGVDHNAPLLHRLKDQLHGKVFIKPPRRSARIAAANKGHGQGQEAPVPQTPGPVSAGSSFFDMGLLESSSGISSAGWNTSWASSSSSSPSFQPSAVASQRQSLGGGGGQAPQRRSPRQHRQPEHLVYYAPPHFHHSPSSLTHSAAHNALPHHLLPHHLHSPFAVSPHSPYPDHNNNFPSPNEYSNYPPY